MYRTLIKPAADFVLAGAALLLLSPVLLAIAVLVRARLGSPVLFRQRRIGLHDRPFLFLKFRTMTDGRNDAGELLPDAQRLTAFGRFLRASSLDELPQLWNVLRGDMSLIGPRPLLPEYLPRYSPRQRRRHEVKPGITGLAQVNGRNSLDWERRFGMDVGYVENCSFALDLRILYATAIAVFARKGISSEGYATMPPFLGKQDSEPAK